MNLESLFAVIVFSVVCFGGGALWHASQTLETPLVSWEDKELPGEVIDQEGVNEVWARVLKITGVEEQWECPIVVHWVDEVIHMPNGQRVFSYGNQYLGVNPETGIIGMHEKQYLFVFITRDELPNIERVIAYEMIADIYRRKSIMEASFNINNPDKIAWSIRHMLKYMEAYIKDFKAEQRWQS